MTVLYILQVALPLALLAWLGFAPLRARSAFLVQVLATALLLLALHLAGLWLSPPWWTPRLYWGLFLLALYRGTRRPPSAAWPANALGWMAMFMITSLGAYAGWTAVQALLGRQAPLGSMVELGFPLESGRYYVANGGSNTTVSSHAATLARATPRQRQYFGQSHAVDIVAIGPGGLPSSGLNPSDPARYRIFGTRVLAPCNGGVVWAVDGKPDMRVPVMDSANMAGNHVLLRCGGADILLAHLRQGSVSVADGDSVRAGRVLGQVGNSGNSSMPHLHIHAQRRGPEAAPFSGTPLPMRVNGQYLVRGDRPSGLGK